MSSQAPQSSPKRRKVEENSNDNQETKGHKNDKTGEDVDMKDCRSEAKQQGHRDEDIQGEHNEWKFRAPYKIHDAKNGEEFKVFYTGSCHCGRVKYELGREKPLASKLCHCHTCQQLHGTMFQQAAIFEKEDINFVGGHHDLAWYDSGEKTTRHKLPCKVSCAYCRSPIMDEGRNMILLFPGLIDFKSDEEKRKFDPECHMFYGNRLIDIPDGKPKWTGINDKSELMDEK